MCVLIPDFIIANKSLQRNVENDDSLVSELTLQVSDSDLTIW